MSLQMSRGRLTLSNFLLCLATSQISLLFLLGMVIFISTDVLIKGNQAESDNFAQPEREKQKLSKQVITILIIAAKSE